MSPDGSKIYYHNNEDTCCNGSSLYLYETQTQDITLLDVDLTQEALHGFYISKTNTNGNILLFMPYVLAGAEGDENILQHRFPIYDHSAGMVTYWDAREQGLVENTPDEDHIYQAYPIAISDDGRYLAGKSGRFHIDMRLWSDRVFYYDRVTNISTRILNTNGDTTWGEETYFMAADSKLTTLGFASDETNLVPDDTNNRRDVFLAFAEPEVPIPVQLLINGNIDDNDDSVSNLPDGWTKIGSLNKDRVRADLETVTYAYSAPNTFQFMGTKGEVGVASKLMQKVKLSGKTFTKGDTLVFSAMVDQRSGVPGTPIARAVVTFNNGDKQIYTLKLAKPKVTGYAPISVSKPLNRGGVKSIKVELFYAKANGKFYIDNVSLTHTSGQSSLLRLP